MLGVNQLDFLNYTTALKGNYRKGVFKLRAILTNPTHAAEFAANLGGVSVVLGVPVSTPDKNSADLLALLLASSVADAAITTWLTQWYEFDSIDDLLNDAGVCSALLANPLTFRAVNTSRVYMGKIVARLAGLNPASYSNIAAVAASSTAMTAVAASSTAMTAVAASSTAMTAVAASSTAMAAVIASPTALNAVVASSTAMTAIWGSATALQAVQNSPTAWATFTSASNAVMGKTVAILAGLNPDSYANMTAVAASSTAMAAVAASSTAMAAVYSSSTARAAIYASTVAYEVFLGKASYITISGTYTGSNWTNRYNGKCLVLEWCYSYSSGTCGIRNCIDDTAARQYTGTQRYNSSMESSNINTTTRASGTYFKEMAFCSTLDTYNSQSDWPAVSIAFFKLP